MSVYFKKGRGWRYDFTLSGQRFTEAWFKTKRKAKAAEAAKRKEVREQQNRPEIPTDMVFLELVNRRLDYIKAYNSPQHYAEYQSRAKRWIQRWGHLPCLQITRDMIEKFVLERSVVSPFTGNKEICCLRATFNFGKAKEWISTNPADRIAFFPMGKRRRYIPPVADIEKVLACADDAATV